MYRPYGPYGLGPWEWGCLSMETLRRLVRNGHSVQVTLESRLLEFLRWRAGDYVVVMLSERGTVEVRPATMTDLRRVTGKHATEPSTTGGQL